MIIFSCPVENGERIGKRFKKSETIYDNRGNVIELTEYKQGKIDSWQRFAYDSKNRIIEQTTFMGYGYDKSKFRPHKKSITYDAKAGQTDHLRPEQTDH